MIKFALIVILLTNFKVNSLSLNNEVGFGFTNLAFKFLNFSLFKIKRN